MQIRPLRPQDAEQAFALRVAAFSTAAHVEYDGSEIYIPDEHRLVAVDGNRVVGHLGIWPFHQAFMGCLVPMGGVAGVVVAHDRRGSGVASKLLAAGLEHMRDAGLAISSLYPSTPPAVPPLGLGVRRCAHPPEDRHARPTGPSRTGARDRAPPLRTQRSARGGGRP
jgi:GNAT superfamily N-acetyltransferase